MPLPPIDTAKAAMTISTAVKYIVLMLGTAIFTIAIASALGGQQRELAERVDQNAETGKAGVAAIVCILAIEPEQRTDESIGKCLDVNGFDDVVILGGSN